MLEIFVPLKIKNTLDINFFSDKLKFIIKESYFGVEINEFNSNLVYWVYLKMKKLDNDLIILMNWEFWELYFVDYDFLWNFIRSLWTKILKPDDIFKNISNIYLDFEKIILELKSSKLLTNTKKKQIKNEIYKVFFTLSWIVFLLYELKVKTESNLNDLEAYSWLVEYEWQASLLSETSKTKKIELEATIIKFENKVEMFLNTIDRLFLK